MACLKQAAKTAAASNEDMKAKIASVMEQVCQLYSNIIRYSNKMQESPTYWNKKLCLQWWEGCTVYSYQLIVTLAIWET